MPLTRNEELALIDLDAYQRHNPHAIFLDYYRAKVSGFRKILAARPVKQQTRTPNRPPPIDSETLDPYLNTLLSDPPVELWRAEGVLEVYERRAMRDVEAVREIAGNNSNTPGA